jgi:hypothetical protein
MFFMTCIPWDKNSLLGGSSCPRDVIAIRASVCSKILERRFAPNHCQARMKHLQEVNRRPLKEELLLQGLKHENLDSLSPHLPPPFSA